MSGSPAPPAGYRFGTFEVDLASASLRRGGLEVRLRGRPFDILLLLLEAAGDIVTREELKHRLWAEDTFVDFDHGLNAAMNRLRSALGDSADAPRYIQTLPRRGYRFLAPVHRVERPAPNSVPAAVPQPTAAPAESPGVETVAVPAAHPPKAPAARKWRWAAMLAAVAFLGAAGVLTVRGWPGNRVVTGRPMLAVLPFANNSGDADQDYLSAGFTDELIAQLGALNPEKLGVIARTTVVSYRGSGRSVADIGRELGIAYALEGSVRRSGPRIRIAAQLIDVATQTQLWAETYDREIGDVLLTERDVAMRVAESLAMSVLRTTVVPRLPSAAAYEAVLRGRYLRLQATEVSLERAREYFEQAIALDPNLAPAYAGLADVYHVLGAPGWEFDRPSVLLSRARDAAERAIALDPALPDGYAVRGMIRLWLQWDPDAAAQDLGRALALNASFAQAHQYLSTVYTVQRRFDEAVDEARRSAALDPLSAVAGTTLGYRLYYAGRFDEAAREFTRALELGPEFASAWLGLAQTRRELGDAAAAREAIAKAEQYAGGRDYMEAHLGYVEARSGDVARARERLQALRARAATRYVSPYHLALLAAGLGDGDLVKSEIERARADRSGWMVFVPLERELQPYLETLKPVLEQVRARSD
ncbi:MAG TPA: winged helix-turn-helix domain-containing protein [Vicinamibacterales bacterium]|nr:winged helix-turn-helix domain-containing protein [Vicinamibacterales bacterium]